MEENAKPRETTSKTSRRALVITIVSAFALAALFIPLAWQETRAAVIAQGDHGRDLYLFDQVAQGKKYLRDFDFIYGPLTLEIYGALFRITGPSVKAALAIRAFMLCILVAAAFWAFRRYASDVPAAIAAFLTGVVQLPFWHTFNHLTTTIGIVVFIGAMAPWLKRKDDADKKNGNGTWKTSFAAAAFPAFGALITLISKPNLGLSLLAGAGCFLAAAWFFRWKKSKASGAPVSLRPARKTWLMFALSLGTALLVYGCYFVTANSDYVHFSFMFLHTKAQLFANPVDRFLMFFLDPLRCHGEGIRYLFFHGVYVLTGGFLAVSLVAALHKRMRAVSPDAPLRAAFLGFLAIFLVHEWLLQGNEYPIAYFGAPAAAALIAIALDYAVKSGVEKDRLGNKNARALGYLPVALIGMWVVVNAYFVIQEKASRKIFPLETARGVVGVLPPDWPPVRVIIHNSAGAFNKINKFIEANTMPGEPVLTLPYMPLHNFLSARPMPTGHLDYMALSGVEPWYEKKVIDSMAKKRVRLVLISNRGFFSREYGLGFFPDACPNLFKYIIGNYEFVGVIGEFFKDPRPGWTGNHGVAVFWKKSESRDEIKRIKKFKSELPQLPEKFKAEMKLIK